MASGLGLQHPDTVTMLAVRHFSQSKNIEKLNPAIRIWSIQRCTGCKSLLRAIRDPFTKSFKLVIKNGSSMSYFTRFINIDKLLYIIVSRFIHKSKGNLRTGLFVYIMTVIQVDSSDRPGSASFEYSVVRELDYL